MPIGTLVLDAAQGPSVGPRLLTGDLSNQVEAARGIARVPVPVDYAVLVGEAVEAGGNTITISFGAPPAGYGLELQRIVISTTSTNPTVAALYIGAELVPANLADYAPTGDINVADLAPITWVPGGSPFHLRWEGASSAARATARIQARLVQIVELDVRTLALGRLLGA